MDSVKDILFFDDAIEETVTVKAGDMIVFKSDTAHAPLSAPVLSAKPFSKSPFRQFFHNIIVCLKKKHSSNNLDCFNHFLGKVYNLRNGFIIV